MLGTLYPTGAALPHLIASGSGHVINISSTAGKAGRPRNGAYAGAKAAIFTLSESMRPEMIAHKVRVTVVAPGATETELPESITDPEAKAGIKTFLSSITLLKPEDVARSIVYAASQPDYVSVNEIILRPTQQPF